MLYYIQMILNVEKSGEQDKERSWEWLVNTAPEQFLSRTLQALKDNDRTHESISL